MDSILGEQMRRHKRGEEESGKRLRRDELEEVGQTYMGRKETGKEK